MEKWKHVQLSEDRYRLNTIPQEPLNRSLWLHLIDSIPDINHLNTEVISIDLWLIGSLIFCCWTDEVLMMIICCKNCTKALGVGLTIHLIFPSIYKIWSLMFVCVTYLYEWGLHRASCLQKTQAANPTDVSNCRQTRSYSDELNTSETTQTRTRN